MSARHYCAWCECWFDHDWHKLQCIDKPLTHGICPDCMEKLMQQLPASEPEHTYMDFARAQASQQMKVVLAVIVAMLIAVLVICSML